MPHAPTERREKKPPHLLWQLLRGGALGYLVLSMLACSFQRRLQYFPDRSTPAIPPGAASEGLEAFETTAADGVRIQGWYWPGAGPVTLYILHGNGGNRLHRLDWMGMLRSLGAGVCIIDYRGYGGSEGSPTEQGLALDADAGLAWLEARLARDGRAARIVYLGESLGGGVAVDLAARRAPTGLIVQSSFSSAVDVAARVYWFLPVRWIMLDRYDSAAKIKSVTAPKLFIHGSRDSIVPLELGRKLHDAAGEPREWLEVAGADHNDLPWVGGDRYLHAVRAFVEGLPGK